MIIYRISTATIQHGDGLTRTTFADGGEVIANWMVHDCQHATADEYTIPVDVMNRQHDLAHSILSAVLGLPASPTLAALAEGRRWPAWHIEERAALALQGFAHAAGVDLEQVAERLSHESASERG